MQPFKKLLLPHWFLTSLKTQQTAVHPRKTYMWGRIPVVLASLLLLYQISLGLNPPIAHAYSCGNAGSGAGHCYAYQDWPNPINGSRTDIRVVQLVCNSGCYNDGFIDNEMWLIQHNNSGCSVPGGGNDCWVEAGYINLDGQGYVTFFWADARPNGGFYFHNINAAYVGDFGNKVIFRITRVSSNEFEVDKANDGCTSQCSASWTYYSTNNTMAPNAIHIGQELAGSSGGASAPNGHFTDNYWQSTRDNSWNAQNNDGNGLRCDNPPCIKYQVHPGGNSTGGDIYTYCCSTSSSIMSSNVLPQTPSSSLGIPAIIPRTNTSPAFTVEDAVQYVNTHPMPRAFIPTSRPTIVKTAFLTSREVSALLNGESTGLPDNTLLCYVELHGTFTFPGPSGTTVTYQTGIEVFDAHTGNFLISGGQ